VSQSRPDSLVDAASDDSGIGTVRGRSLLERSDLVLAFARIARQWAVNVPDPWRQPDGLANGLGLSATIIADWEGVQIQATDGNSRLASFVAASPTGVDMDRVACTMRANRIFDAIARLCRASRTARTSRGWATLRQQLGWRRSAISRCSPHSTPFRQLAVEVTRQIERFPSRATRERSHCRRGIAAESHRPSYRDPEP
jgi:hypothetical protein